MGLFGKGLSAQNGLDFLLGGYGGLDRRRAIDAQEKYQSAIDARGDPILSAVFAANPKAAADNLSTNYGFHNIGAGDTGINGATGKISYTPRVFTNNDTVYQTAQGGGVQNIGTTDPSFSDRTARMNAEQPDYRSVGEGQTLYAIPKVGAGEGPVAPPQTLGSAPQQGTLAQRNNNPGNLRPDGSNWQGMTGQSGGFVQFDTPENGQRAARINLANQARLHGINTLSGLISKYAPATDGNDPQSYIATVARQTGIDPNQPVDLTDPAVQDKILPAMFAVEGGGTPSPQQAVAPPRLASGPQAIIQGAPKRMARPATVEEKAAYGIPPEVPAQMKPDGSIDVVQGAGAGQKQVPPAIASGFIENESAIKSIDDTIAAIRSRPNAFGMQNAIGDAFMQRIDPDGVKVRAAVAAIAGKKRHDVSGAAVSPSEDKNNKPYIPSPTDTAETAIAKLQQLRETWVNANKQIGVAYGADSGYRSLTGDRPPQATRSPATPPKAQIPRKANAGPAVGTVQQGYRFKGGNPGDPKSWVKVQ